MVFYSAKDAASFLGVSYSTFYRMQKENTAPKSIKVGRREKFLERDLLDFISVNGTK